jgi:hypothetical protein
MFDDTRVWLHRKVCSVVEKLVALLSCQFASPVTEIIGLEISEQKLVSEFVMPLVSVNY